MTKRWMDSEWLWSTLMGGGSRIVDFKQPEYTQTSLV